MSATSDIRYVDMQPGPLLVAMGFDARKWAESFVQHVRANPSIPTDEGTMIGWFANALMRGYDEAKWNQKREEDERK